MKIKSISIKAMVSFLVVLSVSCKKESTISDPALTEREGKKFSVLAIAPVEGLQAVGNGTFVIVNRKSGKMLNVAGSATANNTNVVQYGGTGATNQQWTLTATTSGYYKVIGVQSGKGLDAVGTADGGNVQIYDYWGGNNQQWQLVSTTNGYYRIINKTSGKVLEVTDGSLDNDANVQQMAWNGSEGQQWGLAKTIYNGSLTWTWSSTAGVPADVITRVTNAMNDACARYNRGADWPARTITVEYNTGVATADAVVGGHIRFGANSSYQNTRTAMHELGHCYGVGQTSTWTSLTTGGPYTGTNGLATVRTFDTPTTGISTGGGHFWNYGLNYDTEWSETNAYRHVKIVRAMDLDGVY
jgi:hypothetical protein